MTRHFSLVLPVLLLAAACNRTPPERQLVLDAAEALGGADRIQAVRALTLEGEGTDGNIGQNDSPDEPLPVWKVSGYTRTIDLTNGRVRTRATRTATFPFVLTTIGTDSGVDGDVAYASGFDGTVTRAPAAAAAEQRAGALHHPLTAVRAALDPMAQLTNLHEMNGSRMVDVTTAAGDRFMLAVDPATNLPASVTSTGYNPNLGDLATETSFGQYADAGGLMLPRQLTVKQDRFTVATYQLTRTVVDGDVSGAAAPDAARSAEVPPASPPVTVTTQELAPGVWFLAGGSHHSVLFEFSDHLTLFEVPLNDARALAVIAKARELRPNKPLTRAIVSHHHFDHSGGLRAAVSEGLTIVTQEGSAAFFQELAKRQHTIVQDSLATKPAAIKLETFGDTLALKDAAMEVQLYHLAGNPHGDTLIMAYVPRDRLLIQADVFVPTFPQHPFARNMAEQIQKRGLRVDRHVPIHGDIKTHAEFLKSVPPATATN